MNGRNVGLNFLGGALVLLGIAGSASGGAYLGLAQKFGTNEDLVLGALLTVLSWTTLYLVYSLHSAEEQRRYKVSYWVSALFFVFIGFAVTPTFLSAKSAANSANCVSITKDLTMALLTYAEDHDDRLPAAVQWRTVLKEYGDSGGKCALAKSPYSNAFNLGLSAATLGEVDEPANTVMVFEADAWGPNAAGGKEWLAKRHGKSSLANVGMLDGHTTRVSSNNEVRLSWGLR